VRAIFTLAIFVGSFLLFLVQPFAGKVILPTFGGAPAVWNASLVFFQGVLLLGYLYAHLTTKWLGSRQPYLHLGLMLAALLALPFAIQGGAFESIRQMSAGGNNSVGFLVLASLAVIVGLPFFIVSSGAPLLQRWFADTSDPAARDPYFMYAASNFGSMLGLFAYPFLIEPRFPLADQSRIWQWGYFALLGCMAAAAFVGARHRSLARTGTEVEVQERPKPTWRERLMWVGLSAVPSSLLLGVTGYVTINVAPVPLLWVVPLALYLLTFILAFRSRRLVSTEILSRLLPLILVPLAVVLVLDQSEVWLAGLHIGAFFLAAWMCHSRLYDLRPDASRLTEFYLWVSVGGVVGGAFNGLLSPVIFETLAEYPLALVLAGAFKLPYRPEHGFQKTDLLYGAATLLVTIGLVYLARFGLKWDLGQNRTMLTVILPALLCFYASDRPVRFGLALGAFILGTQFAGSNLVGRLLLIERSFYGVHKVIESSTGRFNRLVHGNTLHGMQDRTNRSLPLTYYHPSGPVGQIFEGFESLPQTQRVALVGLGVGSLAAYAQPGDRFTFFEIDPDVVKIARNPDFFTYLQDAKGEIDIVLGDARLTLEKSPDGEFGLIVLDAFSSDAIPVHLITREAMEMYAKKLRPDGMIAYHVSNRYLDLEPVVAANAKALGLYAWTQLDGPTQEETAAGKTASKWMIVAKDKDVLKPLKSRQSWWSEAEGSESIAGWTDDYSNVLGVFRSDE